MLKTVWKNANTKAGSSIPTNQITHCLRGLINNITTAHVTQLKTIWLAATCFFIGWLRVLDKNHITVVVNADHKFAPITIANHMSNVINHDETAVSAIIITHALVCIIVVINNQSAVNHNNHQCAYTDKSMVDANASTLVFI